MVIMMMIMETGKINISEDEPSSISCALDNAQMQHPQYPNLAHKKVEKGENSFRFMGKTMKGDKYFRAAVEVQY